MIEETKNNNFTFKMAVICIFFFEKQQKTKKKHKTQPNVHQPPSSKSDSSHFKYKNEYRHTYNTLFVKRFRREKG